MDNQNKTKLDEYLSPEMQAAALSYVVDLRREIRARAIRAWLIVAGILLYVGWIVGASVYNNWDSFVEKPYLSMVRINGIIAPDAPASAAILSKTLEKAFAEESDTILLSIRSPGGTPTQAYMIYKKILALKAKAAAEGNPHKVIAVAEDSMTSGAYMVAMAADEIYAPPSAIVGSIGVIMESYGFDELAEKLGVERRVFTSGDNKSRFDPFKPVTEADQVKAKEILGEIHNQFIDIVLAGRQGKIPQDVDQSILFSGDYWVGSEAAKLGLTDGALTLGEVVDRLGIEDVREVAPSYSLQQMIQFSR